jgi:polyphenol oxidase
MKFELKRLNGWSCLHIPELESAGIAHGFFTKASPVTPLSREERERFLQALCLNDLVILNQKHGDLFHVIRNGERPTAGDALILLEKNVAAVIKTADCLPVIICEPDFPAAAVIHAGWRGTAKRITEKVLMEMIRIGVDPEKMIALMGPSIGPCCYEVKSDVHSVFLQEGFTNRVFREKEGSLFLDLARANEEMLTSLGVGRIFSTGFCTYCSKDLFVSYRRGETGHRQLNFVSLKG